MFKQAMAAIMVGGAMMLVGAPTASYAQRVQLSSSRVEVCGRGTLSAQGAGQAIIHGDGKITVEGRGTVVIHASRRNDIEASGFGFKRQEGNTYFFEGRGRISVKGTNVSLDITGDVNELHAVGRGAVRLIGSGRYKTRTHHGNWFARGIDVTYGS